MTVECSRATLRGMSHPRIEAFRAPFLPALLLSLGRLQSCPVSAEDGYVPFTGTTNVWHEGFARFDYVMDEVTLAVTPFPAPEGERFAVKEPPKGQRRCIVVVPKTPAAGRPWSWQGCYWDHEPQTEVDLLRRGFHVVFITPDPGKPWDAFYTWLVEQHGLAKKPAFIGMSKGGRE